MSNIPQIPNGLKQVIHVTKLVVKGTWNTLHIWVFHSFLRRIVILPYRLRLQLSRTSYPKGCHFIIPHLFNLWILCKLNTPQKNSWAKIYVFVVVIVVQLPSCVWLLGSHGLLHTRPLCPSPSPKVCPNSCPLHWWCHADISSSDVLFICPQSFPASGTFPMSQLFPSDSQNTGVSMSVSVLQQVLRVDFLKIDWFDLLAVQGTLNLLQHHSLKASILWHLPVTPGISWLPTFSFQSPVINRTSFLVLVLGGLLGLHRTDQFQFLWHRW